MKFKNTLILFTFLSIFVIASCAPQKQTGYVCPNTNGLLVADASLCPHCGDKTCDLITREDCKSCPSDCGKCYEDLTCEEFKEQYHAQNERCGDKYCGKGEFPGEPCHCKEDCLS